MYDKKYQKYKSKYLKMKQCRSVKYPPIIIHIAGASGSGKTFLGNKLKDKFKNNIIVKDLDILRDEHFAQNEKKTNITFDEFAKNYETSYQNFINDFIQKHHDLPIIFVGINAYILGENFYFKGTAGQYPKAFFDLHANYKFYIDLDTKIILKQRFDREFDNYIDWFCDWIKNRKQILFQNLLENEKKAREDTCIALTRIMDFEKIKKDISAWNSFYCDAGYIFLSPEKIFEKIMGFLKIII